MLLPTGEVMRPARLSGRLLGVLDQPNIVEQTLQLVPNSTLLLYTDGATDIQTSAREAFGLERLTQLLAECHALSAQETCETILAHLDAYRQEEPPFDDVTLVAVKVK
jgi:sigma-B regulation protein RsbU (phosphoserine phosphatase)